MAIVQEFFYTKVLFGFRILFHFINFGRNVAPWNHKSPWVPKQSQAKRTALERLPFQISRYITDSFLIGLFVSLMLWVFCLVGAFVVLFLFSFSSFYILDTNSPSNAWLAKILSHSVCFLFTQLLFPLLDRNGLVL